MALKHSLETLHRTLKNLNGNEKIFDGAIVLLSGDFRQTLQVIPCSTFAHEISVLDESRSFFRVHTGYFSNIPKCIKAEFIASWACSQSSVVSSSQR
ncbi:hypothetical protein TNCV_58331 [Trichonephila clavipes]|nr:hypothetical protein TNCV_58331 [Trichonephila clavipes]